MSVGPKMPGIGPVLELRTIKRRTKRRPRRLVESVAQDWARWDAAAASMGLNFAEFARRALNAYAAGLVPRVLIK